MPGQAKGQHGLARAARRGPANGTIQVCLTAVAMNLKRLAKAFAAVLSLVRPLRRPGDGSARPSHAVFIHEPVRVDLNAA